MPSGPTSTASQDPYFSCHYAQCSQRISCMKHPSNLQTAKAHSNYYLPLTIPLAQRKQVGKTRDRREISLFRKKPPKQFSEKSYIIFFFVIPIATHSKFQVQTEIKPTNSSCTKKLIEIQQIKRVCALSPVFTLWSPLMTCRVLHVLEIHIPFSLFTFQYLLVLCSSIITPKT